MLGTVVAIGAPPASAGPYCEDGHHCVFIVELGSSKKAFFNSDTNFSNDYFDNGYPVDNFVWSASNSSTGNYESHYYYGYNYSGGLVFCVNPGSAVDAHQLSDDGVDGNGYGQRDEASSLRLRPRTSIRCF